MGCGKSIKSNSTAQADSLQTPADIQQVVAIAKVLPAEGIVQLSTDQSGIVESIYKQPGDTLRAAEPFIRLRLQEAALNQQQARQEWQAQQANAQVEKAQISGLEAEYKEKFSTLQTSKTLAAQGAETRYTVETQEKELALIKANLAAAKQRLSAANSKSDALSTTVEKTVNQRNEQTIRIYKDAVILSRDVQLGEAVNALQPFATIAYLGDYILAGEIDEMFASRVAVGQRVLISAVGMQAQIAEATIYELAPLLASKSLFYENSTETNDRRVRQFKAKIVGTSNLLINAKVECKILIN